MLKVHSSGFKVIVLVTCNLLLVTLLGCDAFVRKFTRKQKKQEAPQEEMILAPQEYLKPQMDKEEEARQYFLFWKSWQDELIESLSQGASHKKQVACLRQATENLMNLKGFLNEEAQGKLELHIAQLRRFSDSLNNDLYGNNAAANLRSAERIKRDILKDISYSKIKNFIK